ncbi:hypothetical protein C8Q77DRAFT_1069853 [Trametes polyzona]|nr:hypothetical protein C8Q77DRAFT_1069853 [Trametes polyzona]
MAHFLPASSQAQETLPTPPQSSASAQYPESLWPHVNSAHAIGVNLPPAHASIPPDTSSPFVSVLIHRSQLATMASNFTQASEVPDAHSEHCSAAPAHTTQTAGPDTTPQRKTRGVKVACTNCRRSNKRCDEARPCQRCIKGKMEDSCVNPSPKPMGRPRLPRSLPYGCYGRDATPAAIDAAAGTPPPGTLGLQLSAGLGSYLVDSAPTHLPHSAQRSFYNAPQYSGHAGHGSPAVYPDYYPDTPPSWPPTADHYASWGTAGAQGSDQGWDHAGPSSF